MKRSRNLAASLAAAVVATLAVVASAQAATSGSVLDQQATGTPSTSEYVTHYETGRAAQSFTPAVSGRLTDVVVHLRMDVGFTFDAGITVAVTPVAAGLPDLSTTLASATIPSGVVTTTAAPVEVTFSTPAVVTAGQQYAIVLTEIAAGQTGGSHTHYRFSTFGSSTYAGGSVASTLLGSSWAVGSGDAWFQTYVLPVSASSGGSRAGYCLGGRFLDLIVDQPESDPLYKGASAANFLEGRGITCDAAPAGWVVKGWTSDGTPSDVGLYRFFAPVG